MRQRSPLTPGFVIGTAVVLVGTLLLLRNFDLIRFRTFPFWPIVIAWIGAANLMGARGPSGQFWGGMILAVGVYLGLDQLGYAPVAFWELWPVLLILAGAYLLLNINRPREQVAETASTLNEFAMFGGGNRRIQAQEFDGGTVFAVFGGYEIDLRGSTLRNSAVIYANVVFGGIEIKVPDHWLVSSEGVAIFGGYEDSTIPPKLADGAPATRLVVKGFAVFGGVEVKN